MFEHNELIVECRGCGYEGKAWGMLLYCGHYYCNVACKLEYAGVDGGELGNPPLDSDGGSLFNNS